jgi:hypothetical protein
VGPRAGLDDVEKRIFLILPGLELRFFGRPASSQALYRLRYPGLISRVIYFKIRIVGGGVQLGPVGTAATNRPIVPAPDYYDDR